MRRIFRSLIYQDPAEQDATSANCAKVNIERLLKLTEAETAVLEYVLDFYGRHGTAPAHRTVHEHFEKAHRADECALIEEFGGGGTVREGADFEETFEQVVERQAAARMKVTFQEALKIATSGFEIRKGETVQGLREALAHVYTDLQIPPPKAGTRLAPDMTENAKALKQLYNFRESNPSKTFGVMTGYRILDKLTGGIRKKGLYIHAGFASHLKSTFMLNQCVNSAVRGWDVLVFSDEMAAEDLMVMAVAIHSANPQFAKTHPPVNAFKAIMGRLEPEEKKFFLEVQDHLVETKDHGHIRIYDSGDFTSFGSVKQIVTREHARRPVDLVWIDYLTRLPLDAKYLRRGVDYTTGVNLTIVDAKHFSMEFDGGAGLPVCTAFQVNREGLRRGTEAKGRLDARHLGQYNAAEKEGDLITYSWYGPEEKNAHEVKIGFIKNRWGPVLPDPMDMFYHAESRLIHERGGTVIQEALNTLEVVDEVEL